MNRCDFILVSLEGTEKLGILLLLDHFWTIDFLKESLLSLNFKLISQCN